MNAVGAPDAVEAGIIVRRPSGPRAALACKEAGMNNALGSYG